MLQLRLAEHLKLASSNLTWASQHGDTSESLLNSFLQRSRTKYTYIDIYTNPQGTPAHSAIRRALPHGPPKFLQERCPADPTLRGLQPAIPLCTLHGCARTRPEKSWKSRTRPDFKDKTKFNQEQDRIFGTGPDLIENQTGV